MPTTQQINKNFHHFWQTGNGYEFKTWGGVEPKLVANEKYNAAFHSYDQQVDEIVSKAIKDKSFGQILQNIAFNGDKTKFSPEIKTLMEQMETAPDWLDQKLVKSGVELSQRTGLLGLLVLRNFCLLAGYYYSSLTQILVATGALEKGAKHRLYNTLSFWVEVTRLGENAQEQRLNACLKTRLIHSAARLMLLKNKANVEDKTMPINDMDMIATNIGFTLYFLYALKKFGFAFSPEEEAGVFHLWKYHTWLLGAPKELIPNNKKEAIDFFYYWTSKQGLPDESSVNLAKALLEENTALTLLKPLYNEKNLPYIHKSAANFLIDQPTKTALEIPEVKLPFFIPTAIKIKNKILALRSKSYQIERGNFEILSVLEDYKK